MIIRYISYINSPAADPAKHHAVIPVNPKRSADGDITPAPGTMTNYPMSEWRQQRENTFMDDNQPLFDAVNSVRAAKATTAEADYRKNLHTAKLIRQKAWLDYLSAEFSATLNAKLDELEVTDGKGNKDVIYVAALPEFFWRDIDDHHKSDKSYNNYGMPFYNGALNHFLRSDSELIKLTRSHPNLIIFAGTIWWKIIDPEGVEKSDGYQNTLAVFHTGKVAQTWRKQWTSGIDGTGSRILKPVSLDTDSCDIPYLSFMGINFGMDICLDFVVGDDGTRGTAPVSRAMLTRLGMPVPEVQVLIAGGMPVRGNESFIHADRLFLRCDALPDVNSHYADIVGVGSAVIPWVDFAAAPITDNCLFVFDPVDIH